MNRKYVLRLVVVLAFGIACFNVRQARPKTIKASINYKTVINGVEWSYSFSSNMEAVVWLSDPRECGEDLVIPDYIEGYPVTSIANGAFYGAEELRRIYIPGTVESIKMDAFGRCIKLNSVYFGGSSDTWDRLKGSVQSGNNDLYDAWEYYFMDMSNPPTLILKDEEQTKVSVNPDYPDSYNRYYDEWESFGEFTYQWFYSSTNQIDEATPIEGATSDSYTVKELGLNYYYFCKITNEYDIATKVVYSNPVQVITEAKQDSWIISGTMLDKYGNPGTEEKPYIIKNSSDFDCFSHEICTVTGGDSTKFEGKYIKAELSDGNIVLAGDWYAKEFLNFKGILDANGCVIENIALGAWEEALSLQDMESLEEALLRTHNVIYKDMTIYIKDYSCMMEWYQWFYGTGAQAFADKNIRFENLEICLEK